MPIPTSNVQKQIQMTTPAQSGKAVNVSEAVGAQLKAANDMVSQVGNILETGFKVFAEAHQNAQRLASDDAAKNAFNEYEVTKDDLNTQLQSLQGQDAVDFYYGDYTKKLNEAHKKLTATLDSLPDKDIARSYRDQVNKINLQNRGFSFLFAQRQLEEKRKADDAAYINNVLIEHQNDIVTAPKGVNPYQYAAANAYADVNKRNIETLQRSGMLTPEILESANRKAMTKFATDTVQMVADTADWDGAKTGEVYQKKILPAVEAFKKYVDPSVYMQLRKTYAGEALSTDAALRPDDFRNPLTGEIDKDFVNSHYEGLDPWEKTRIIESIKTALNQGHNTSLTADERHDLDDIQRKWYNKFKANFTDLGIRPGKEYREIQQQQELSDEDIAKMKMEEIRKFDLSKAARLAVELNEFIDGKRTLLSGKEAYIDSTEIKDLRDDLNEYMELYIEGYKKSVAKEGKGWEYLKQWFTGTKATVMDAALHDMIMSQKKGIKNYEANSRYNALVTREAIVDFAKKASLDSSVQWWDARANSENGYGNEAIRDKVKLYTTESFGEAAGQIDVYGQSALTNTAVANGLPKPKTNAENAIAQWAERMDYDYLNAWKLNTPMTPGMSFGAWNSDPEGERLRYEFSKLTPVERYRLQEKLNLIQHDLYKYMVTGKNEFDVLKYKQEEEFNNNFFKGVSK